MPDVFLIAIAFALAVLIKSVCVGKRLAPLAFILMAALLPPATPAFAACTSAAPCVTAPIDLGTFGGATSEARGVNSDGSVVVGNALTTSNLPHAFRWTSASGLQDLGTLGCSGFSYAGALGINSDGSVVVGNSFGTACANHAFRWTSAGGMQDLGTFGGDSVSQGTSADGSVVVGYAGVGGNAVFHAFRWIGGVMSDIGTFVGGANSFASGVNGDGSVITGHSNTSGNTAFITGVHAYRWTSVGGMQDIGTLGGSDSAAFAINTDGSVIVGRADSPGGNSLPFRWTSLSGMQSLGTLGGNNPAGLAFGVNGDGSVVVGQSFTSSGDPRAFRWTAAAGMQDLNTLLAAAGINMTGVTLTVAYGVSNNGFIVGQGNFPTGANHAFVVRYDDGTGSQVLTKDSCKDGGWQNITLPPGPFKNQGQCVSYFAHQK